MGFSHRVCVGCNWICCGSWQHLAFSVSYLQERWWSFLIPYLIAVLTVGIPLIMLEVSLGHKSQGSAPVAFSKADKRFSWLGWWQPLNSLVILVYYSVIIGWALNYIVFSFTQAWGSDTNSFFYKSFLGITSGPFDIGGIRWPILIAMTVIWFLNWFIVYSGVQVESNEPTRL